MLVVFNFYKNRVCQQNEFDEERIKWITERYSKPEITYFEIYVDNEKNKIMSPKIIEVLDPFKKIGIYLVN